MFVSLVTHITRGGLEEEMQLRDTSIKKKQGNSREQSKINLEEGVTVDGRGYMSEGK